MVVSVEVLVDLAPLSIANNSRTPRLPKEGQNMAASGLPERPAGLCIKKTYNSRAYRGGVPRLEFERDDIAFCVVIRLPVT